MTYNCLYVTVSDMYWMRERYIVVDMVSRLGVHDIMCIIFTRDKVYGFQAIMRGVNVKIAF